MTDADRDEATVTALPARQQRLGLGVGAALPTHNLPMTLRVMLDEQLYDKLKRAAGIMSKSEGFVPRHLLGKPEACFAVLTRSLEWRLDPYFVAQATYQTPGGQVGFEGKLCQAILENSGRMVGGLRFEHFGDWERLTGKFEVAKSAKGNDYVKPTWTKTDARGLGVKVFGQVRGEDKPREWSVELVQCYPLNSTLWATDPKMQICYLAARRFGNIAAPGIYGGVRFNVDEYLDASEAARDVTPEPPLQERETRSVVEHEDEAEGASAPVGTPVATEEDEWEAFDAVGDVTRLRSPQSFARAVLAILDDAASQGVAALDTAYNNNRGQIEELCQHNMKAAADEIAERYAYLRGKALPSRTAPPEPEPDDGGADAGYGETEAESETEREPLATEDERPQGLLLADPAPTPEKKPAAAPSFWDSENTAIDLPRRQSGSTNWPAYAEQIVRLVATAPNATALVGFQRANSRGLSSLRVAYAGGSDEVEAAIKERLAQYV